MVEKRDYSRYQQKVIRAFYENREQIDEQALSDLAGNLYLAEGKKREKLWQQADEIMQRMRIIESRRLHIVKLKDPSVLAELIKDLASGATVRTPAPKPPAGGS